MVDGSARRSSLLDKAEARRFYNLMGRRQDWQWLFERIPVETLLDHGAFGEARSVVEFGCGTGHVAEILFKRYLSEQAVYYGFDLSPVMIDIARRRLEPYGDRANVQLTEGAPEIPLPDNSVDRFLSTYVLDLLSIDDINSVLNDAHRVLTPGGLVCLTGLTFAQKPVSKVIMGLWTRIHSFRPWLVGGCRPLELSDYFPSAHWELRYSTVITRLLMPSEIVVVRKNHDLKSN